MNRYQSMEIADLEDELSVLKADYKQLEKCVKLYASEDCEIIKKHDLEKWLDDCRSNPDNFTSGILYKFGMTNGFASDCLKKIK